MNQLLGTKFNIIIGYKGSRGVDLAMERGEVGGRVTSWASAQSRRGHWYKGGKIHSIAQIGPKSIPALNKQGVPRLIDWVKGKKEKSMVEFLYSLMLIGRASLHRRAHQKHGLRPWRRPLTGPCKTRPSRQISLNARCHLIHRRVPSCRLSLTT